MRDEAPPSVYRPSRGSRRFGLAASLALYALIAAALLVAFRRPEAGLAAHTSELTVIDLAQPAPAPAPPQPAIPAPTPPAVISKNAPATPVMPTVDATTSAIATTSIAPAAPPPTPAAPAPAHDAVAAPAASPEQPAGRKNWEGEVLARLYQFRRYPASSRQRGEQGVPRIRFVVDRTGHVLSCTLEQRSGYAALDREAVSLPSRAQPLPPPPADRDGATITLVVPVEFTLN